MSRLSMNVVAKVGVRHHEHTDKFIVNAIFDIIHNKLLFLTFMHVK